MIVQIAANGHLNVLKHLDEHYKGDIPIKALEEAAAMGHPNVIKYLEPRIGGWFNVLDTLFAAALNGHAEATEFLLAKSVLWRDLTGLAKKVVAQGHVKVVRLLIRSGRTKIHPLLPAAAGAGSFEMVEYLLPMCDLESITAAIGHAARNGHVDMVKFLLERGDLQHIGSAFVQAASMNQVETMMLLLDAWETRPTKDEAKLRAIPAAVKEAVLLGHLEVVRLLADRCDPKLVGPALRMAVVKNNVEIAKVLAKVSTQLAIAHQAATAASRRLPKMTRMLLRRCEPAVLETVLEDMVACDNLDTAKVVVEESSDEAIDAVLAIAVERDCASLVIFLQGLLNSSVSKL